VVPQDVLENVLEFTEDIYQLLLFRQVCHAWLHATCSVAELHRRSAPEWTWLSCSSQDVVNRSAVDERPCFPALVVHPRLILPNLHVKARRIMRAALVLMGPSVDRLALYSQNLPDVVQFARKRPEAHGWLSGLRSLRVAPGGAGGDIVTTRLSQFMPLCPQLIELGVETSVSMPASFFTTIVARLPHLTTLTVNSDDILRGPPFTDQIIGGLRNAMVRTLSITTMRPTLTPPVLDDFTAWSRLTSLDLVGSGTAHWFRTFPPSLRTLRVNGCPETLPSGLTSLTVRRSRVSCRALQHTQELRTLSCDGFDPPANSGDLEHLARVVSQLEELSFTVSSDPLEPAGDVLRALGHSLRFLKVNIFNGVQVDVPALSCTALQDVDLWPGSALDAFGPAVWSTVERLGVQGPPALETIRMCEQLTALWSRPLAPGWTDSHTDSLRSPSLRVLAVQSELGVTRLPLLPVAWSASLTYLDVSRTSFTEWATLAPFTALRTLKAVGVPDAWDTLPLALSALHGLDELRLGSDTAAMPALTLRVLAEATVGVQVLELNMPVDDAVLSDCLRRCWLRLRIFVRSEYLGPSRTVILEALQPAGGWALFSYSQYVVKALDWNR
jgi:hypothetical protein